MEEAVAGLACVAYLLGSVVNSAVPELDGNTATIRRAQFHKIVIDYNRMHMNLKDTLLHDNY